MTTRIDTGIPEAELQKIVNGLSRVLADSYTVYLKTHNYHWNVVGPMFHSLHTMFMDQYTELALAVDDIAERIRALGAPAPGTYREFVELSIISEDTDHPDAPEMIRRLVSAHEAAARTIRGVLPVAESAPDQVSTDLLVRRLDAHEKTAWMLRSMIVGTEQ
ncbi:DNA starvation/stationary phase protection protein [Cryobacterium sp. Hh11]|uniref:Dps family protein n=1 Tax=Cryobacterium sp. Hh11 TaxID=2555868 RepID=UPI00106B4A94|nr:Dps family protein [Cryobacterium sp. Hh11]TFD52335.1 DNA starvation/stationary phase protection protein [Cryobacterium sp. Hh11]